MNGFNGFDSQIFYTRNANTSLFFVFLFLPYDDAAKITLSPQAFPRQNTWYLTSAEFLLM